MVTMELIVTTLHTDGGLITQLHLTLVTFQTNIFEPFKLTVIVLSLKGQKTSTDDSYSYSWCLLYCNPQWSSAVTTCRTRTRQPSDPVLPVCSALLSDHAGAWTSWPLTSGPAPTCSDGQLLQIKASATTMLYNNSQCHVNVDNLKLYFKNRLKYN